MREKKPWQALLLLSAGAVILMLHSSLILWEHLPKLQFVQFPWRWMGVLGVPYAYFSAAAVRRWRPGWVWAVIVVIGAGSMGTFLVHEAWWDSDDIPALREGIASEKGFDGTDEYDPAKDDHTNLPATAPRVHILAEVAETAKPNAQVRIDKWTAEEKDLSVTSPQPFRLAVRLLDYPAWRVEVNGQRVTPQSPETNGQIILPIDAGSDRVTIRMVVTLDRIVGGLLSLTSGLTVLLCISNKNDLLAE